MFETRLGILVQTLIWKTSKHGQRGAILLGGRELVRGLRGTRTFHLFHLVCKFPWIFAWFGFLWVLLCLVGVFVLVGFCFRGNLISIFTHSSCWPTMSRTSTAMQGKKKIATCNHSVVCMFTHHVFPSGNCHLQSHGWPSKGGRWQPMHVWGLLPIRGSRPPSDLLTRHCVWPRVPGCVLSSFPYTTAMRTPLPGSDPSAFLCAGRCTGYCARGHQRLQLPQWRLARRLLQWCTTMGGLQNK